MRKFFVCLIAVVAVLFASSSASAINLIYEPFDYTSGLDLGPPDNTVTYGLRNTQAGTTAGTADNSTTGAQNYPDGGVGNKWLRASTTGPGPDAADIFSGSLTGPADLPGAVGNSLSIIDGSVSGNPATRLAFNQSPTASNPPAGQNINSGTIYYSFLLNVDDLTGSNNIIGSYFMSLNNTANANTGADPTVVPGQMRIRIDPNDPTKFSLGTFTNRQTMVQGDAAWFNGLAVDQTHFIVGALNVSTTAASTRLWVNPDASSFGDPTAPAHDRADAVHAANSGSIGSLVLHQRNVNPALFLDEIRVATTWAEAVPLGSITRFWDIDALGTTPGAGGATPSGTWDSSTTNWNTGATGVGTKEAWTPGVAAVFSAGTDAVGAYTVTVSGTQSVSSISFEDGSPTLTGGTLDFSGTHTITASTGITATIESVVTGSVGIDKNGAGTVVLTADETYSGPTTINAGTLQVGNGGTSGTLPTGSGISTSAGGRLTFNQSDNVTQGTEFSGDALAGTGGLTQAGSATLTLNVANNHSGTTRAGNGTLSLTHSLALQNSTLDMNGSDTGTVSIDSSLTALTLGGITGSRNFSLTNSASAALALTVGNGNASAGPYTGQLTGGGRLTKVGTGTQVLSGANTYTGLTNINSGTLQYGTKVAMPATVSTAAGDHNGDGSVDAADYVTWRKNPGAFGGGTGYATWRANFGNTAQGLVTVNNGGTLAVNAGGTGEWTDSALTTDPASIASIIVGTGGQGAANQITWMPGSALAIDTTNAPGAPTAPALTYSGVIGGFRTAGGGTTNAVGFTKRGAGTLTLSGNNTFSGQLSTATNGGTLQLTGTNANAGSSMTIPTVAIGAGSTLQLSASNTLPNGSLISSQGPLALFNLDADVTQTIRSLSGNNGVTTLGANSVLTIADQAGDDYTYGNGAGSARIASDATSKIYKTGPGTFGLFGDAGLLFDGTFILQQGTLSLSRNQALSTTTDTGRLVVEGGRMTRNNSTGNLTYGMAFVDLHVFRYDLGVTPTQTSQFSAPTTTTLKQDDVEMEITNTGTQTASSGRFTFLGPIRNHDPSPFGGDNPLAIRGITKTGNGVLTLAYNDAGDITADSIEYRGPTTVEDGRLLVDADGTIGEYDEATVAKLFLKGGAVATTTTRTVPIKNPIEVDGNGGISHMSTAASASTVMEFSSDSIVGTSGSLTITNENNASNSATVFRPRFTGSGFNFGLPIVVSDTVMVGTGAKSNELQSGNTTGSQTYSGVISGGGSFARVNAGGTAILTGSNTYSGGTTIDGGTLLVNNTAGSGTGTGAVAINTGGTLGGTGAISGAVTLNSGGILAPGTSIDSLDVGALAVSGGLLSFELGAPSTSDLLNVTGTDSLTITSGLVDLIDAGGLAAGTYTLIDYAGTPLTDTTVNLLSFGTTPGGFIYDLVDNATNTTIDLVVTPAGSGSGAGAGAVPEPGSVLLAVMAMVWALAGFNTRPRRAKS